MYLQAKSLKVYTGLLGGSGVWETERNSLLITSETPEAKWHFMIPCHANSGEEKGAMIFVIAENFNYDVNTEKIYQTFKILINYLASSSWLFQTCVFWISQKIECLTQQQ